MAGKSDFEQPDDGRDGRVSPAHHVLFYTVCALVIGVALWATEPGRLASDGKDCYYNLLVQGFQAGQLNVKKDPPVELGRLANPYDPAGYGPEVREVRGMSYYHGKLYLYFGIVPVLLLYWPYVELTGHYLTDVAAAFIFCLIGFLAGAGLLFSISRRCFPKAGAWAIAAGILVFGLAVDAQETEWVSCGVAEVALSSAFAFTMIALAAIWHALQDPKGRVLSVLLASLAYGLAIGSRPSLLPGAVILLVPLAQIWRRPRETGLRPRVGWLFASAVVPITLIGLGLMLYNFLRFRSPLEFGYSYELSYLDQTALSRFSLHYFWFNLRYYVLEPGRWTAHLPFLLTVPEWASSTGHFDQKPYYGGILFVGFPLAWMALGAAWALKSGLTDRFSALRWFVAGLFLVFATSALTLCFFLYGSNRYEMDFLPPLIFLAVIGFLAVDQTLSGSPQWRYVFRFCSAVALAYSLVTNICASCNAYATANYFAGNVLYNRGLMDNARQLFERALAFAPQDTDAYDGLGNVSFRKGDVDGAIAQYQKALEQRPDFAEARNNLGRCLLLKGRLDDAIAQFEKAVQLRPRSVNYRNALGAACARKGQWNEAIVQFEKAIEIEPAQAETHNDLGYCFLQTGRIDEAIGEHRTAVRLEPGSATFLDALANDLCQKGLFDEAAVEYKAALKVRPDYAEALNNLGYCLEQIGRLDEAIVQYQKAIEFQPGFTEAYYNLGNACRKNKMPLEAINSYEKAVESAPQFVAAQVDLAWMLATWPDTSIRNGTRALALAQQANRLSGGQDPKILSVLAAAYAETGRFPEAIATAHQASLSATAQSKTDLLSEIQSDIQLYQNHLPCRSTRPF